MSTTAGGLRRSPPATFEVSEGGRRRFVPDFLVRLANGRTLVLEIKGEDSDQDKAKRSALDMWVQAVNSKGGFGVWSADVAFEMARMHDVIGRHAG